jgi:hypothetical protein
MSPSKEKKANGNGNGSGKGAVQLDEPRFVDLTALFQAGAWAMDEADRDKLVHALSKPVSQAKPGQLGEAQPISFVEEALAVLFLLFFLGAMCVRAT